MIKKYDYIIKYKVLSSIDIVIKQGTIKVKNKQTPIAAQIALEKYLNNKIPAFNRLVVETCEQQFNPLGDIFSNFSDIFSK